VASSEVTVVVPTHARDEFLGEAIASVLAQELAPAALIVSDDLGAPSTRALVERWAARASFPVRYLDSSGPGAGTAGASRNAGAALVSTPLVAFLDDDDAWHPQFLARTVAALGELDFVVAWIEPDDPGFTVPRMVEGLSASEVVARNPGFVGSNFLMRPERYRELEGFDPTLPVSNDKDLLVRALAAGARYAVVPEGLVRYRVHSAGQLTDKTPRRAEGIRRYVSKHAELLSPRDRRILAAQLASVERVAAPSAVARFASLVRLVLLRSWLKVTEAR